MPKKKKPSPASELASIKWAKVPASERKAHSDAMNAAKMLKTTFKQRSASAKKARAAREAKRVRNEP